MCYNLVTILFFVLVETVKLIFNDLLKPHVLDVPSLASLVG